MKRFIKVTMAALAVCCMSAHADTTTTIYGEIESQWVFNNGTVASNGPVGQGGITFGDALWVDLWGSYGLSNGDDGREVDLTFGWNINDYFTASVGLFNIGTNIGTDVEVIKTAIDYRCGPWSLHAYHVNPKTATHGLGMDVDYDLGNGFNAGFSFGRVEFSGDTFVTVHPSWSTDLSENVHFKVETNYKLIGDTDDRFNLWVGVGGAFSFTN
ncbi:MAG: hypothetical protein HKM24_07980 [Gammaproteobacteria bacterium]|nr:hypothetical protein [Gammaproteobacteria bacterium]